MNDTKAIHYAQQIPDVLKAMAGVNQAIDEHGFDRALHHLVQLRASQMNRCGFCVEMHTREARDDGETSQRLDTVVVWDQVSDFSEKEKAALAWTEALTALDATSGLGPARARLREHFSEREIGILTSTIAMINLWNRINISRH